MNGQNIIDKIHFLTKTGSGTYPDADILSNINMEYGILMADVLQSVGDYNVSGKCSKTAFLTTTGLNPDDNGYDGHYSFPTDLLRPVRVELSYDGENYVRATEYDLNENEGSESNWDGDFGADKPYVRYFNNYFVIRPTPDADVASGIHIYYEHRSVGSDGGVGSYDITALTSPAFEETFHPFLVWAGCEAYGDVYSEKMNPKWEKRKYGLLQDIRRFYSNKFGQVRRLDPVVDDYS